VTTNVQAVAARLFAGVMAPLVLGGAMRPGRAIGARAALALGEVSSPPVDSDLAARVQDARVRSARTLVPIDQLAAPTAAEWALGAALHDLVLSANPAFDMALRRGAAVRILELAAATIDHIPAPATVLEALARHSWLARVLDIARTDTAVSFWVGTRSFLGVDPPRRLQAWPDLRRVSIARTRQPILGLTPLAFERERFVEVMAKLLARTPLTEFSTCTRGAPAFVWSDTTLALVSTLAGRRLALRALARLPAAEVDAALSRATRDAFAQKRASARSAIALLADRAIALAQDPVAGAYPASWTAEASFARGLGAAAASRALSASGSPWPEAERQRLIEALEPAAAPARAALATLEQGSSLESQS
jgi:hypothetical protein